MKLPAAGRNGVILRAAGVPHTVPVGVAPQHQTRLFQVASSGHSMRVMRMYAEFVRTSPLPAGAPITTGSLRLPTALSYQLMLVGIIHVVSEPTAQSFAGETRSSPIPLCLAAPSSRYQWDHPGDVALEQMERCPAGVGALNQYLKRHSVLFQSEMKLAGSN